jgi:hypothetical protein
MTRSAYHDDPHGPNGTADGAWLSTGLFLVEFTDGAGAGAVKVQIHPFLPRTFEFMLGTGRLITAA